MAGKHNGANGNASMMKEEMKSMKIKKVVVTGLLAAVWAAAARYGVGN